MGVLAPEVVDRFQRDGFVRAEGVLDPAEVARFRAHVDRAVAWRTRRDPRGLDEKTPFEQSFTMCQYLWEDHPDRPHHSLDRDHIAVGAPIDGRATPIAYPLAGGRLPEPIPFPEVGTHRALGRATEIGIFPKHARG